MCCCFATFGYSRILTNVKWQQIFSRTNNWDGYIWERREWIIHHSNSFYVLEETRWFCSTEVNREALPVPQAQRPDKNWAAAKQVYMSIAGMTGTLWISKIASVVRTDKPVCIKNLGNTHIPFPKLCEGPVFQYFLFSSLSKCSKFCSKSCQKQYRSKQYLY